MRGLILSGGKGTRLRPITHTSAKQLIPVANKPVLFYGIEALREAGIREIGLVVGETRAEIRQAVGNGSRWDVAVTYIEQEAPLGLAHAVLISEPFLRDEAFIMYLGDNVLRGGVTELVREFESRRPNAQILLARVPNPEQFGVAELDGGRVRSLVEKPREPRSDLALVGVYMFDHQIFKAVREIKPSARGELEITDAIQWLVDHGFDVAPHVVTGWWKDMGRPEDLLEANRMMLDLLEPRIDGSVDAASRVEFKVVIEPEAEILNSTVRGPAIIGQGSIIRNSFIGPFTSVGPGCRIENCEIEHSIVLEGSRILDLGTRIVDSLIGKDVEVTRHHRRPQAYRLMLGDASRVGLL
ncbi:MAG: glucose-1-phosphate thymidylyltransferase [Deltaproteobacteria bacterium]|nr:glucose-1-phosphate thymidylyltransferase [Deltaproteobacteria bacterium]